MAASLWGLAATFSTPALAAAPGASSAPVDSGTSGDVKAERVDVESLKKKYWAKGDQYEMQVVQNRTYSKARNLEVGIVGGFASGDPFLSIKTTGMSVGYHFTEYFGLQLMGWKYFVSDSQASVDFRNSVSNGAYPDTNRPKSFYGGELQYSPIYGKLSVMGQSIIYYDFHIMAGGGVTNTESGNDPTFHFGLGQQVYLSRSLVLKFGYRFMSFSETLLKTAPGLAGQKGITRTNSTTVFTIGLSFLI